jgi:hypothetical protein
MIGGMGNIPPIKMGMAGHDVGMVYDIGCATLLPGHLLQNSFGKWMSMDERLPIIR